MIIIEAMLMQCHSIKVSYLWSRSRRLGEGDGRQRSEAVIGEIYLPRTSGAGLVIPPTHPSS